MIVDDGLHREVNTNLAKQLLTPVTDEERLPTARTGRKGWDPEVVENAAATARMAKATAAVLKAARKKPPPATAPAAAPTAGPAAPAPTSPGRGTRVSTSPNSRPGSSRKRWGVSVAQRESPMVSQLKALRTVKLENEDRRIKVFLAKEAQYRKMNEEKEAEGDRLRRECAARREEQFTQSMKAVADGMEGRIAHLTLADEHVRFQEEWRRQKSREIHAEWEHKVYDKIAQKIKDESDMRHTERITRSGLGFARPLFKDTYRPSATTRSSNAKGARDPAVTLPDPIRVDVVVKDPMKKELVKTLREKQLLQSLLRGHMERDVDVVALGRLFEVDRGDRLDVAWWDKVDSTPYGYTVAEKDPALSRITRSAVKVDHWDYPRGAEGNTYALKEHKMGAAKRRVKAPTRMVGATFADVVQQTDGGVSHDELKRMNRTAGDWWLEAKGKRAITGVEATLSDLYQVVQPEGRVGESAMVKRDLWIERKGRRHVPGPEQRRNRSSLFPIVQPAGRIPDPYQDGNALGDAFLEQIWYQGRRALQPPPTLPGETLWETLHHHEPPKGWSTQPLPKPKPGRVDFSATAQGTGAFAGASTAHAGALGVMGTLDGSVTLNPDA